MDDFTQDFAGRFINASERIKETLGKRYRQEFNGLGEACRHAVAKKDRVVTSHRDQLKVLIDLRNVMQHSHVYKGLTLATPREDAVFAIEELAEWIENPPKISQYMIKAPETVSPADPLNRATELVIDRGFSQVPVYDSGVYQALFTTNALARWLSAAVNREMGSLLETDIKVDDVLSFVEEHEKPRFVGPNESTYRVCDLLSTEDSPPAVLVTTDGKASGQLQGIVTRFDVPSILKAITVRIF